jgi:hypothetical protein
MRVDARQQRGGPHALVTLCVNPRMSFDNPVSDMT